MSDDIYREHILCIENAFYTSFSCKAVLERSTTVMPRRIVKKEIAAWKDQEGGGRGQVRGSRVSLFFVTGNVSRRVHTRACVHPSGPLTWQVQSRSAYTPSQPMFGTDKGSIFPESTSSSVGM
jgi:hypothetical protein